MPEQTNNHQIAAAEPKEIGTAGRLNNLLATPAILKRFDEMLGPKRRAQFVSSIVSAVSASEQLQKVAKENPMSIVSSAAIAASMDLPVTPGLGFAHIVPYGGVAQFQIGWKGLVQLALRSGQYKTIKPTIIREGDIRSHNRFTGHMEFNESNTIENPKIVGYLLYFQLLNGYECFHYMTIEEAKAHGLRYSATFKKGFGKWKDDFDAMALKTVIKMGISKFGPMSIEMQKVMTVDEAEVDENGNPKGFPDRADDSDAPAAEKPKAKRGSRLDNIVDAQVMKTTPTEAPPVQEEEEAPHPVEGGEPSWIKPQAKETVSASTSGDLPI